MATNASPNIPTLDGYVDTIITTASRRLVRSGAVPGSEKEDLEQDLRMAVIASIPGFDTAKASWHTFANGVVQRALKQYLRDHNAQCRDASRCTSINNSDQADAAAVADHDPMDPLSTIDPRTEDESQRRENAEEMAVFLARLPKTQRDLATALMEGLAPAEIMKRLGWSRESFYYHRNQLRQAMQRAGLEPR